eukprot:TRINITY_DN2634_c0_g2_i4.p1 TRINITY_DN2634_c0_g2~~TRINITY_DN2634_c0_g2_i4.p1  ORF type:complete len:416 (-),score=66.10 TRINITY_DN2634_c0_g2_i4:987-2234(-)
MWMDKPLTDPKMESEFDLKDYIVIDNGTDALKIGFSGEDTPRFVIPTLVGHPIIRSDDTGPSKAPTLFGVDVEEKKNPLLEYNYNQPVKRSKILGDRDLDDMRQFWNHILENEMQLDLAQCQIMIIDSPNSVKEERQKLAEIFFEELKVNALLFMNSSVLSLFSTGRSSGLVIESGHGTTSSVPVFEGFALQHAIHTNPLAGMDIEKQLHQLLIQKEDRRKHFEVEMLELNRIIRSIKEKIVAVGADYQKAINLPQTSHVEERSFELPDRQVLQLDHYTRHAAAEILFNPSLIEGGSDVMSIPDMISDSISRIDADFRGELYRNIVMCGGTSLLKGYPERLRDELRIRKRDDFRRFHIDDIHFVLDPQRKNSSWIGGSMVASLAVFQGLAITKAEYEENPETKTSLVYKKTFQIQ